MRTQTPVSHVSFSAAPKMAREVPRRAPVRQQRRGPESEIFLLVLLALLIGAVIYRAFFH